MRELGRESLRKLKPMRFAENQRKLLRQDVRDACRKSRDLRERKAVELAEGGFGYGVIVLSTGIDERLARALVLGG